jgi:hypothetical protein
MDVKTGSAQQTSSSQELDGHGTTQPGIDPKVHGRLRADGSRRSSWIAVVAVVACAGLATAGAIEVFDGSSSSSDAPAVSHETAPLDSDHDVHREPGQTSSNDVVQPGWDQDFHREAGQRYAEDEAAPYGSGLPHEAH